MLLSSFWVILGKEELFVEYLEGNHVLFVGIWLVLFPYLWMFNTSLKPQEELYSSPIRYLPSKPTLSAMSCFYKLPISTLLCKQPTGCNRYYISFWNEFIYALTFTSDTIARTIPVGLHSFMGEYTIRWELLTAGGVLTALPVVFFFVLV